MFTHRTATPGRVGSNDGYGVDATFSFYPERPLRHLSRRHADRRTTRRRPELSRLLRLQRAIATAFQVERLVVEPNFLPEIGFLRRTDMRRNFGLARFSPRPTHVTHVRRFTDAGAASTTSPTTRTVSTRASSARRSRPSSPTATWPAIGFTDNFERLTRPFNVATGVDIPVGAYDFHTLQLSYTGGQQRKMSGHGRLRSGQVLRRRSPVDRRSTPRACR